MNGLPARHSLTHDDLKQFERQMRLPGVGLAGQRRLLHAHVAVIGLGALGCPVVTYLARAGVGRMTVYDQDTVAIHNLHRQTIYTRDDVGRAKAEVVRERVSYHERGIEITAITEHFTAAAELPPDVNLILDCTDRFSSRFTVHDAARRGGIDLVSGAVSGFSGQLTTYRFSEAPAPCLRCLYPQAPPDGCTGSCAADGILGAAAGVIGAWQATVALRLLLKMDPPETATTCNIDLASFSVSAFSWPARDGCACMIESGAVPSDVADVAPEVTLTGTRPSATADDSRFPATIVDIREPEEELPLDATLVPLRERVPMDRFLDSLDRREREIHYVLICEHGVRSALAREMMESAGFPAVSDVAGGFAALRSRIRG
ncbi:MAG: ThiF family adenylyltransferase [Spirochaeta sp.]|jgi:molybdopterin/thiamine biosynthesis adenylyltransferase/rhodanese-related sulfurtransferase|nr:ThiF family adenylyltransferase [Spirochaeta sp.]